MTTINIFQIILVVFVLSAIFAIFEEVVKSFLKVKVSGKLSARIIAGLIPRLYGAIALYLLILFGVIGLA